MKRGGIEDVMASHIYWASPMWSVLPLPEHWCWLLHTPNPSISNFSPFDLARKLWKNICMNAQSFLSTHPRGVLPVWCWASDRQFKLCGVSSVSLYSGVCSSSMVVVHMACLAHMTIQGGAPSVEVMRKSQFQWRNHEHLVCWFLMG